MVKSVVATTVPEDGLISKSSAVLLFLTPTDQIERLLGKLLLAKSEIVRKPRLELSTFGEPVFLSILQSWLPPIPEYEIRVLANAWCQLLADRANTLALGFYGHLGWRATELSAWRLFLPGR